ncbi:PapD-like protein [Halteromyces radiatus]|uniref:PapD-like protein n=1 Tax=Halteromyces radiatus TaxID=101107 RepID=UPI00221FEAC2|nr:PapD-like protein [Halteromyces radiatus]KAI8092635.1 PapD-like protein [Halteromyces radiatus]
MTVVLDPPTHLSFKRPLTQPIEEFLYVRNVGVEPIAFKVKTTAPKQYCVRPNSGIIQPSSHVEVQVIFQPFKEEPAPDFKCKDKFLVQTAIVKPEWSEWNMVELWSRIEADYRDQMSQRKVKCVFLPPELPQPVVKNEFILDEPPTPTSSQYQQQPSENKSEEQQEDDDDGATSSPTLSSTLPAIIDAANKSSNNKGGYDPTASSISLLTARTTMATPTATTKPSSHHQSSSTNTSELTHLQQQWKEEKIQLQQDLSKALAKEKTLEQQLIKERNDAASAHALVERLQQQIKTLERTAAHTTKDHISSGPTTTNTTTAAAAAAAAATAHAMQTSPLTVEGYPPQVLLSVSAFVFIFTYLFF